MWNASEITLALFAGYLLVVAILNGVAPRTTKSRKRH
jgi:hypothetical protein